MINRYLIGYREKIKREQADIIRLAYQTAAFTNSKNKPKNLSYYINQIMNFNGNRKPREAALEQIAWAKALDTKIEAAKRKKEVDNNGG